MKRFVDPARGANYLLARSRPGESKRELGHDGKGNLESLQIGEVGAAAKCKHIGIYGALVDIGTGQDALAACFAARSNGDGPSEDVEEVVQTGEENQAPTCSKSRKDGHIALDAWRRPPAVPWQIHQAGTDCSPVRSCVWKTSAYLSILGRKDRAWCTCRKWPRVLSVHPEMT